MGPHNYSRCSISVLSVVSTSSSEPAPSSSGERARGVDKADDDEQATGEHATGDNQADGNEQATSEHANDNLQTDYDEQANDETPATSVEIHGSLGSAVCSRCSLNEVSMQCDGRPLKQRSLNATWCRPPVEATAQ